MENHEALAEMKRVGLCNLMNELRIMDQIAGACLAFPCTFNPYINKGSFLKTSEEKGVTYCAALNFLFSASSEWSFEVHELGKLVSSKVSQGMLHLLTLVEKVSSEP